MQPSLAHVLQQPSSSVLSLAADENYIYTGSQAKDIHVWSKQSFTLLKSLKGHTGSVLALEIAPDRHWLFSSSSDSTVWIWSTKTLEPVYVLHPYLETASGDLFSLTWCGAQQRLYIGCQNTSLQWYSFASLPDSSPTPGTTTPKLSHKFFRSQPRYVSTPSSVSSDEQVTLPVPSIEVPGTNVIDSHYGYIYCMIILPVHQTSPDDPTLPFLVTGSGDETIKLWSGGNSHTPILAHTLQCHHGAVLALAASHETIYAGCQDGHVKAWDVETKTLIRTIIAQEGVDILSLSLFQSDLYTCSANGIVQRWSSFNCTASWTAHSDSIILSSIITVNSNKDKFQLITGGNDGCINVWNISACDKPFITTSCLPVVLETAPETNSSSDALTFSLEKFISFPSVSSDPLHREDCRQAAIWLKTCLNQLGAQSTLLPTGNGLNPLVLATFTGAEGDAPKPRVLFYGHYDVIPAPEQDWSSAPFSMSGRNGYLYGRGASDNKGPILAAAFATAELLRQRTLKADIVFLIEGEEECGSTGFEAAVKKYKDQVGRVDLVLVSNSTWITEHPPCITYGLRGVVHCSLEVSNYYPDVHSGIEGGGLAEPMMDMVKLLATLTDETGRVQIPGFYEHVRPQNEDERQWYIRLSALTQKPASNLASRWREPALTVHNISVSGPQNSTVIPSRAKAQISLRIVPDQDLQSISTSLETFLKKQFARFKSPNALGVSIEHAADWWLGDLEDPYFKALEGAISDEWGIEPLRIREGGSIPSIPYLEKEFGCHALQLPLGQASDQAHLANERIALTNLVRGKSVIERFLTAIGSSSGIPVQHLE